MPGRESGSVEALGILREPPRTGRQLPSTPLPRPLGQALYYPRMDSAAIRTSFTDFFVARGHLAVPSASLVPSALDQSVLLTTAGMQPFKPYFLGQSSPPAARLTSVQRCFRTVDIDVVGTTARHCTFFQMMGNFSFGDYFKQGAVEMAWELSTSVWGLEAEKIWATVYEGDESVPPDDEARALWIDRGIPDERIVALGEDNFWKAGATGPCGPCSELYYDRGIALGCGDAACAPGCDCDRFLEYWNLVFMQYDRDDAGGLTPLPAQNIDTGSGVERVAMLLQNVDSVYETDAGRMIIGAAEQLSGRRYGEDDETTKAFRVLCDHSRGMVMLATDGVKPGNEGRGYVLRRILRRAVQHGSRIGLESPFLGVLHDAVIESLGDAYPELVTHRAEVRRLLEIEEDRFARTLATGSKLLDDVIAQARTAGQDVLDPDAVFKLHDTYGFPVEVTAEIAREAGLAIDQAGFDERMETQRQRARAAIRRGDAADAERLAAFSRTAPPTTFVGYEALDLEAEVTAAEPLEAGRVLVKLSHSPFYAEGGGQVSDHGTIESMGGRGDVEAVYRIEGDQVLLVHVEDGELTVGEAVRALVDPALRRETEASHTGTHLLHQALRDRLGEHVHQAGSAVRPDSLRFDFTHDAPLTADDLRELEDAVNRVVLDNRPVSIYETSQDEARALGAQMLFGEKYGERVRVVDIEGYSRELCGGTHVPTTAAVGPLSIVRESSVGQGVRRIEALTGAAALERLRTDAQAATAAARLVRVSPDGLAEAVAQLQNRVRELEKAARQDGGQSAPTTVDGAAVERSDAVRAFVGTAPDGVDLLPLVDGLKGSYDAIVLGAGDGKGGVALVSALEPSAIAAGLDASAVIRAIAPLVGGGGGGRPTMARAGGKDPARLGDALAAAREMLAG